MPETHKVFVYGTLREGQSNRGVMTPHLVKQHGLGRIRGVMYDWGAYPALTLEEAGEIVGEWVEVTGAGLKALDRLEDYPHLYQRDIVEDLENGLRGWVYHMPAAKARAGGAPIPSGDWVWHCLRSRKT
ncbi:gamma-glutamylcyclotransferase family protein [Alicyclobacillus vulcanalis]|uniref:Uncharacterized conserved protein YtfP, gamma-glutamylcyclotransferase (GGCT)/AIG2-like family n=1 Tax=Alicyclobacillus vulcanalis TaxID=252246 RepID=A0A1N7K9V4_9BACL|nr:gamma-glutamylcyclotransferase family protein [Alicyclobacillus vulcanalis]SIS58312.1 Uncharacterized conserved protein YtfP, gamma-glutamylcyclotransferase (GGCT)/AIG2-like family [Alicyclobacillus vulcanalis]